MDGSWQQLRKWQRPEFCARGALPGLLHADRAVLLKIELHELLLKVVHLRGSLATRDPVECGRYVEASSRTGTQVNGGE